MTIKRLTPLWQSALAGSGRVAREFAAALRSAVVWFVLLLAAGVCSLGSGVYVLAGAGWALVVLGALCMLMALLLLKGLSRG